jgi:probable HAF family extracellular repeat protein
MARLNRIRSRRRALGLVTATTLGLLGLAGPSPAMAAEPPPATPEAPDLVGSLGMELGSQQGSSARRDRSWGDASGGFIYRDGKYTPLDSVDGFVTAHVGINDRRQTAGAYVRSLDPPDIGGFVRGRMGRYTRFDVAPGPSTLPVDINDRGTTIGVYGDAVTGDAHAFRHTANGDVTTIDVDGAQLTGPFGINNRGAVVGTYVDADGVNQAYLMERGEVTTIVPPDSPDDPARAQVIATDINDRGQVVGCYADANGTYHGFRYHKGRFTRIDPPGGADVAEHATTCPFGINNRGHVVGQYVDAAGVLHGYFWRQGRGFETIDPPRGAQTVGPTGVRGTVAADINDRGDILLPVPGGILKGRGVPIRG